MPSYNHHVNVHFLCSSVKVTVLFFETNRFPKGPRGKFFFKNETVKIFANDPCLRLVACLFNFCFLYFNVQFEIYRFLLHEIGHLILV